MEKQLRNNGLIKNTHSKFDVKMEAF